VFGWDLVDFCEDNHPYSTTCIPSVNSLFRHLDHASIIYPPPETRFQSQPAAFVAGRVEWDVERAKWEEVRAEMYAQLAGRRGTAAGLVLLGRVSLVP
jgi:hypothetical protein